MANKKSDVKAKLAYTQELIRRGYQNPRITSAPSDIQAILNGVIHFFEVKMTKRENTYFGAATTTEWAQALKTPDRYHFVVVQTDDEEKEFRFREYTPEEFLQFSTIPPFKVFFNLPLTPTQKKPSRKKSKALRATKENLSQLIGIYKELKAESENE